MDIENKTIENPEDIHEIFAEFPSFEQSGWWFRGQSNESWELLPKAGRADYKSPMGNHFSRFYTWSRRAVAYDENLPENDWERLAVAQHHGLVTCLLDWTRNPLIATFFACNENPDTDGAIFTYHPHVILNDEKDKYWSQKKLNGVGFIPRSISKRILNQSGVFTIHIPVSNPLRASPFSPDHPEAELSNLCKILIPSSFKQDLIKMLDFYGINSATIFPDLDGLSVHVNEMTKELKRTYTEAVQGMKKDQST